MVYRVAINGFGPLRSPVDIDDSTLRVGGQRVALLAERDPAALPWADLTARLSRPVTVDEVNAAFAAAGSEGPLAGILRYTEQPLVSRDIVGDPHSCVLDAALAQTDGALVKVFGWYDNEWGYTRRLVDLTTLMAGR